MLIKEAHAFAGLKLVFAARALPIFRFGEFLVKEGIDSISINPDTVIKATLKNKRSGREDWEVEIMLTF